METIEKSHTITNAMSVQQVIDAIIESDEPARLAGQYAFEAALDADGKETNEACLESQLDCLREHFDNCCKQVNYDYGTALLFAKQFAHQHNLENIPG